MASTYNALNQPLQSLGYCKDGDCKNPDADYDRSRKLEKQLRDKLPALMQAIADCYYSNVNFGVCNGGINGIPANVIDSHDSEYSGIVTTNGVITIQFGASELLVLTPTATANGNLHFVTSGNVALAHPNLIDNTGIATIYTPSVAQELEVAASQQHSMRRTA